jgi:hypothetical protein
MRILSRPMFRYGGPIKEGVMHGMRNNYQSGQLVRPGPGRPGYQGNPRFINLGGGQPPANVKIAKDVAKKTAQTFGQGLYGQGTLSVPNWLKRLAGWIKPGYKTGVLSRWGLGTLPAAYVTGALALQKSLPKELKGKGGIYETASYADPMSAGADVSYDIPEVSNIPEDKPLKTIVPEDDKWDPGAGGKQYDPSTSPSAIAAAAKKARMEKLDSYLDMMGYDRAKRGALDKALIDASALVQDATTEAGSLKEADWGKLINRAIQTTSKRLDKPEQIREAVGLMMTKGEIEKDIAEGKGSQYDVKEKYLKGKLGEVAGQRAALQKPTSLSEALLSTKATDSKTDRTSQALRSYYDGFLTPTFKGKISQKKIDALGGDVLKEGMEIGLDNGVYQISKSYIVVEGNKIIKFDDVFASGD